MQIINKERYLMHLDNQEDKILVSKVLDKAQQCFKQNKITFTAFLDPRQIHIVDSVVTRLKELHTKSYGGYEGAERKIMAFYPDFIYEDDVKFPIRLLDIYAASSSARSGFSSLTHRDFLGALLSMGITREKIGDIILSPDTVHILVAEDIADYLAFNLESVGRCKVCVENRELTELEYIEPKTKEIYTTVASLRLDSIAGAGFGISRSRAVEYIQQGRAFVNWECVDQPSRNVKEGDTISLRGKGRLILEEVGDRTRKDRISVRIKRFI